MAFEVDSRTAATFLGLGGGGLRMLVLRDELRPQRRGRTNYFRLEDLARLRYARAVKLVKLCSR